MKIFKETMIMLLVCLAGILLFALVFYKYIPNRKVVPEVTKYSASEQVLEQLSDKVDQEKDKIIKTYEVTSSDLNNYKVTEDYVPGKANPFASPEEDVETNATTQNPTNQTSDNNNGTTNTTTNTSNNNTSSNSQTSSKEENKTVYITDKGTK